MSDEPDDTPPEEQTPEAASLLAAAPALARLAAHAWWRTAGWTAESSVRAAGGVLGAARSGEPPTELLAQAGAEVREYARRLLGLAEAMDAAVSGEDPSSVAEKEPAAPEPSVSQR